MVAVFTGNGLGLFDTSLGVTGGSLSSGAGRDRHGVNVLTGNLVLQGQDELLTYRGLSLGALRTYNSAGTSVTGGDGWLGMESTVTEQGLANQPGSTVTHRMADGGVYVYTWDAARAKYVCTDGDGAHDTFEWNATSSLWIREDGNTLRREYFQKRPDADEYRLWQVRETRHDGADMARMLYVYDSAVTDRLVEIRTFRTGDNDTGNDAMLFSYDANGRLSRLSLRENGATSQQVDYGYDGVGRLAYVEVDLTPTNTDDDTWDALVPANNDGRLYRTSYTYDGNSLRIASVTGSDGGTTSYAWHADGKVKSVTRPGGDTTTFAYTASYTNVTDSLGRTTTWWYWNGRVSSVHGPARDGIRDVDAYTYDDATGDLVNIDRMRGDTLLFRRDYEYDARGNVLSELDTVGNVVRHTWNSLNQLTSTSTFTVADYDGPGNPLEPGGERTTRYVYEAAGRRLRFVIGPSGEVTEMRYGTTAGSGALGQLVETRTYHATPYTGAGDLADLEYWVAGQQIGSTLTALHYDAFGRLARRTEFAQVGAEGDGYIDAAMSTTTYLYDARGLLLKQITARGADHPFNGGSAESGDVVDYVYDGLGRLLDVIRHDGGTTYVRGTTNPDALNLADTAGATAAQVAADLATEVTRYRYADSQMRVTTVTDAGVTRVEQRDGAGRVVSTTESAAGVTTRAAYNHYDAAGQLRAVEDFGGARTFHFYDERGFRVLTVDPTGAATENEVDTLGRTTRTLRYATRVTTTGWMTGDGASATPNLPTLAAARPAEGWTEAFADATMTQFNAADLAGAYAAGFRIENGRLVVQRAENSVAYNPRLVSTAALSLSSGALFRTEVTTGASQTNNYLLHSLHNGAAGNAYRRVGALIQDGKLYHHTMRDGVASNVLMGYLDPNKTYVVEAYAGEGGIEYRVYVKGQDRNNGFAFRTSVVAGEWPDARLQLNGAMGPGMSGDPLYVDNVGYRAVRQNTFEYDYDGDLIASTDGGALTTYEYDAAHQLLRTVRVAAGQPDRVGRQLWNASGRLVAQLDAEGYLTEYVYDGGGRVDRIIRYANPVAAELRADGDLDAMRPLANGGDQTTRYLYDARGRTVGELDAEGYLTETVFDDAGREAVTRRYAQQITPGGTSSLEQLISEAMWLPPAEPYQETRRAFDASGRLVSELNHENTLTKYYYDHAGRVVRTEAAANVEGEVRNGVQLFDAFGHLVGELDPAVAMNGTSPRLLDTMSYEQKLAVIDLYGTRHEYDGMGRRIESIDRLENRTWYTYDGAGRLAFTLRGQTAGGVANAVAEVAETRYNSFGEVAETLAYTGTLTIGGARTRADALVALATLPYSATVDTRRQFFYDTRGLLIQQTDAMAGVSTLRYNAFGELVSTTTPTTIPGGAATSTTTTRAYDRRGLTTDVTEAAGSLVARTTKSAYDAFGRVVKSTDGRNLETLFGYDRLGRQVSSERTTYTGITGTARVEGATTGYDAFSRVVTQINALGQKTTYTYSDTGRSVVVKTPDGLETKTERTAHGETFRITAPGGGTTTWTYDLAGRVKTVTDPLGDVATSEYDPLGRLAATIDDAGTRIEYTYDAVGRVLTRTEDPGTGRLKLATTWTYDGQGRVISVLDPAGRLTTTKYDREGRTVEVARDPNGLNLVTKYTWDAGGRQVKLVEHAGATVLRTSTFTYDERGRRTSETLDAVLASTTSYVYDAADNVVARIEPNGAAHYFVYDQANRLIYTLDTVSGTAAAPTVAVTRHWYDEAGRCVATRRYASLRALTTQQTLDLKSATGGSMVVTLDTITNGLELDGKDAVEYRVHDPAGKLKCVITQVGATKATLREIRYDTRGNANYELAYTVQRDFSAADQAFFLMQGETDAGTVAGANTAWERQVRAQALITQQAQTARHRYGVFDAAGNERYVVTIDDLGTSGFVVERQFDHAGRVVAEIRHAKTVTPNAAADVGTVQQQLSTATPAQMLVTRYVYDRAGRLRYTVDDAGYATQQTYDGAGRVTETRRFTVAIAPAGWDEASVATALTGKASLRVALNEYDTADRLKKVTDALGGFETFVYDDVANTTTHTDKLGKQTVHTYDDLGRLVSTKDPLNYTESFAYDGLGNRTKHTDKNAKVWTFEYDARGNLTKSIDPLGFFETFTYDALGNRDSYTDKTRTATWNYEFDQLGRMVKERSPTLPVYRFSTASGGTLVSGSVRIETVIVYDAFGNVTSRTENAAGPVAERRTTTYAYDSRGHQIRTTFPRAWEINSTSLVLADTLAATTLEVTYDALGRAVMQKDTRGGYSYKVYDQLDRVVHDIDAEGYVTSYDYDALGRQTSLTRRAAPLGANVPAGRATGGTIAETAWSNAIGALATTGNRIVTTKYDDAGRKIEVTTGGSITYWTSTGASALGTPTTKFEYDAAGHVVRERVLIEKLGATEVYAETWHWYDAVGNRTHTVDPERYLTKWTYDAMGRELSRTEFARAVTGTLVVTTPPANPAPGTAATSFDRSVSSLYDDAGRRTRETTTLHYQTAAGADTSGSLITHFEYDKEGRNTKITVDDPGAAADVVTINAYDALGRLTGVTENARSVLKERWNADGTLAADDWRVLLRNAANTLESAALYETISPYTRMDYDAFGNVVRVYRPGRGTAGGQAQTDQVTTTRYDYQGRAVVDIDAEGVATYTKYNAADQATDVFYDLANGTGGSVRIVERMKYDLLGRQTARYVDRGTLVGADGSETVSYNAFGEIVAKAWSVAELAMAAKRHDFAYDLAGRMTDSDEAGANRRYRYNLAGQQVAELRDPSATQPTRMVLDKLGRATTTHLPAYDDAGTIKTVVRTYDRWGNVLRQIDARGGVTDWTYNERNQQVTQTAPSVTIVGADGVGAVGRPETRWWYDAGGRLIGVRDANGNTDRNEYDAVGRLVRSFDALNYETRYGFDGLGRGRVQQDVTGYQSTRTYDRRDRVIAVGDYLLNGGVRTQQDRETYTLNRNGDRTVVTNGESETQRFTYDARGLLLRSQSAMGAVKEFAYDVAGNRTSETYAPGAGQVAQTWTYDVHNRLTAHTDLGGNVFGYGYDSAGRLSSETSNSMAIYAEDLDNNGTFDYTVNGALSRTTTYYANGLVREIRYSATEYTLYQYDENGNRTLEKTYRAAKAKTATSPWLPGVNVETRVEYDSHNRVTRVTTDDFAQTADFGTARMMTVEYSYDAVGNRRYAKITNGFALGMYGEHVQEGWYTYDGENRVLIEAGALGSGQIYRIPGLGYSWVAVSAENTYDAVGRLATRVTGDIDYGNFWDPTLTRTETFTYSQRGERLRVNTLVMGNGFYGPVVVSDTNQTSRYDKAGRLLETVDYFPSNWSTTIKSGSTTYTVPLGHVVRSASVYTYDDDGRVVSQAKWGRKHGSSDGSTNWAVPLGPTPAGIHYVWSSENNATGLVKLEETVYQKRYGGAGYDGYGRLTEYRYTRLAREWNAASPSGDEVYTHWFATSFVARDSFLEGKTSAESSNSDFKATSTQNWYDAAGRHHFIEDHTYIKGSPDPRTRRQMVFNGDGQILLRVREYRSGSNSWEQGQDEGNFDLMNLWDQKFSASAWANLPEAERERWYDKRDNARGYFANGHQVASVNEAGQDLVGLQYLTGFSNTTMGRGKILVQEGDTLHALSQRAYGTTTLWYVIADANGLTSPTDELPGGTTLNLPQVRTATNDYATFKPYDPSEITGPTTPNLPYMPPPDQGCGAIGTILMVIVIIIVTVYTAGAAAGALGVTGTTAGAAAGTTVAASTASIGASALAGTAVGGVTLGATAGTLAATSMTGALMASAAIGGFVGTAVGTAFGSAMGVASFSWKGALASGAAAGLTAGLGSTNFVSNVAGNSRFAHGAIGSLSNSLISQATSRAFGAQTSFSWKALAVNAVSGGVSNVMAPYIGAGLEKLHVDLGTENGQTLFDFSKGMAGGLVSAHLSRAAGLTEHIGAGGIAAHSFATAIGNRIGGEHKANAAAAKHLKSMREIIDRLIVRDEEGRQVLFAGTPGAASAAENDPIAAGEERLKRHAQNLRELAGALGVEEERTELWNDYIENGEDSVLGSVLGGSSPFSMLGRALDSGEPMDPKRAERIAGILNAKADGVDAFVGAARELIDNGGELDPVDLAFLSGDYSGLTEGQLFKVADNLHRASLISPERGVREFLAEHTRIGAVLDFASSVAPVEGTYEAATGIGYATLEAFSTRRQFIRLVDKIQGLEFAPGANPFAVEGFQNLFTEGMELSVRFVRSVANVAKSTGAALLRRIPGFKQAASGQWSKRLERWRGEFSRGVTGELMPAAFDLLTYSFTDPNGGRLFKKVDSQFRYRGGAGNDIDRVVILNDDSPVYFELKGSSTDSFLGLSKDQKLGAPHFVRDRLERIENDPTSPRQAEAREIRREFGRDPIRGYVISGRNLFGRSPQVVLYDWTANARPPRVGGR